MSDIVKNTSQYIDNMSFDETYQNATVEIVTENVGGTALVRQKPIATEAKQDDIISELQSKLEAVPVSVMTIGLASSGNVLDPAAGKKVRIYGIKFSLSADMTSVSFRWNSGGTDFLKFLAPKSGGLYGINLHSDYIDGVIDDVLYCSISGTGTVQINLEYLEV